MIVNDELIDKLSHLSRIELKMEEREEMKFELEKMVGFINKLNELNTDGVNPLIHMSTNQDIFRKDEVFGEIPHEEVFENIPSHQGEFFKVPKVIQKNNS